MSQKGLIEINILRLFLKLNFQFTEEARRQLKHLQRANERQMYCIRDPGREESQKCSSAIGLIYELYVGKAINSVLGSQCNIHSSTFSPRRAIGKCIATPSPEKYIRSSDSPGPRPPSSLPPSTPTPRIPYIMISNLSAAAATDHTLPRNRSCFAA